MTQSIDRVNIIMYAKLLCGAKMKTADHGVTSPLIPWSGDAKTVISSAFSAYRGTRWSEYEVKVPSFTPLMPRGMGSPGVLNDWCIMFIV